MAQGAPLVDEPRRRELTQREAHRVLPARAAASGTYNEHSMRFTAAVTREGRWYVAQCLEIEVASQGETFEVALANLREAIELRLEDEPAPLPQDPPIIATVEVSLGHPAA